MSNEFGGFKHPVDPARISPGPDVRPPKTVLDHDVPTWAIVVAAICVALGLVVLYLELFGTN